MRETGDFAQLSMLEKSLAFHVSGHLLHSILWTNLSPNGMALADSEHYIGIGIPAYVQQARVVAGRVFDKLDQ